MKEERLNDALNAHFAQAPVGALERLEGDVWRRIHARKADQPQGWLEQWLAPILVPQYRFATLAVAIALGLSAGEFTKTQLAAAPGLPTAQMLNLQVFSPQTGLLLPTFTKERS